MSEKSKNILLGVLIVGLVSMTVAYAALSTTLTISGTASIPTTKWDIEITDWTDVTASTASLITGQTNTAATNTAANTPTISSTSVSGLAVTLNQPGDVAKYTFNITNKGTIAAKLASKTVGCTESASSTTTTTCPSALTYTISCGTGANEQGQTLAAAASDTAAGWTKAACTLTVSYPEATNANNGVYNQSAVTAYLYAQWVYEQN